jgi:hypothetical protein
MPTAPAGASDRLSAAQQHAHTRAAERLAPKLEAANTKTYHRQMQATAKAFGQKPPKAITDAPVLADIRARAIVSAQSIVSTQSDRMRALVAQEGSLAAAQAPFKAWEAQQLSAITAYESSMAVHAAQGDFVDRNQLDGTEHLEPTDAAVPDECQDAIDMGEVPIGTLSPPYHVNCPHYAVQTYLPPDDPSTLWFGT